MQSICSSPLEYLDSPRLFFFFTFFCQPVSRWTFWQYIEHQASLQWRDANDRLMESPSLISLVGMSSGESQLEFSLQYILNHVVWYLFIASHLSCDHPFYSKGQISRVDDLTWCSRGQAWKEILYSDPSYFISWMTHPTSTLILQTVHQKCCPSAMWVSRTFSSSLARQRTCFAFKKPR